MPNGFGFNDLFDLIIQNEGFAIHKSDQNGVSDLQVQILDGNDPHFIFLEAQYSERQVFDDRIVLAITELGHELARRGPKILLAPVVVVSDVLGLVHTGVDFSDQRHLVFALLFGQIFHPAVVMTLGQFFRLAIARSFGCFFLGKTGQGLIPLFKGFQVGRSGFLGVKKTGFGFCGLYPG